MKLRVIVCCLAISGIPWHLGWAAQPSGGKFTPHFPGYGLHLNQLFQQAEANVKHHRRAPRALLFSALIPGLGQVYNKSYVKAGIFLAVEVVSWYVYVDRTNLGNTLEDEYEAYADAHWSADRYWAALATESGCDPQDENCLKNFERGAFSHHLPDVKNQTYYENIGKYDQFNIGWDDAQGHKQRDSDRREKYTLMRKDSNDAFALARTGVTIALLNHIVSALEAAFSAHKQDKKIASAINIQPKRVGNELVPALALRVQW